MPQRDPGVYLEDIEYYAAAAVRFTSSYSLQQYLADEKTRAAVERVLEICGEAMSNLYKTAPAIAEGIPHARDITSRTLRTTQPPPPARPPGNSSRSQTCPTSSFPNDRWGYSFVNRKPEVS